jgi:thioredoxin-related protein
MKTLHIALLAFGLLASLVTARVTMAHPDPDTEKVEWKTLPEALDLAPKTSKKIVLDVYTDWCGWCKRMDRDTYGDSGVAAYMREHYVASKMNPEKEGTIQYDGKAYSQREFGQALGVNGYPATAVFNEKNELLTVIPGYIKPAEFIRILKYFGDDAYLKTEWKAYMDANPIAQ